MRRLLPLALLAACATAPAGPPPVEGPTAQGTRIMTDTGTDRGIRVEDDATAAVARVAATRAAVWEALPHAYRLVGIENAAQDSASGTIGVTRLTVNRVMAGERLSTMLSCGNSIAGPVTESHTIRLSVSTQVEAAERGSVLRTMVRAVARSNDGTGRSEIRCASTGRLEQRIADAVRRRTGG